VTGKPEVIRLGRQLVLRVPDGIVDANRRGCWKTQSRENRENEIASGCVINDLLGSGRHFLSLILVVLDEKGVFQQPQALTLIDIGRSGSMSEIGMLRQPSSLLVWFRLEASPRPFVTILPCRS